MKRKIIIAISALLVFTMLLSSTSVIGFASAEGYQVGDHIYFGSYPQSKVKDSATLTALNGKSLNWISYGYYSGDGSYGSMVQGDWMKYADTTYNGNKYRAVKFTQYRPYWTEYSSSASNSYQDNNGYELNTVYWFKYDPIEWRILDPAKGLVVAETCIDSQAFSNTIYEYGTDPNGYTAYWNDAAHTHYASDYATSSIRKWLNDDFYNTAFNDSQKSQIATTTLDNSSSYSSTYDSVTTNDKVFLLSYYDVKNPAYGFSSTAWDYDVARRAKSTDYAKAQGCYRFSGGSYDGNAYWRLRSPASRSYHACSVDYDGFVFYNYRVSHSSSGVRPALTLNLTSEILTSIEITSMPTKTTYTEGENFDSAGMVVTAKYTNEISATVSDYTVTNGTNLTEGQSSVTVSYTDGEVTKTATVDILVNAAIELESIRIETNPTVTSYKVGDTVSPAGLKVMAVYSDTSEIDVTSSVTVSNFNASTAGNKTATVSYNGKTVTFNYTVTEDDSSETPIFESIRIETNPTVTSYKVGDTVSLEGLKVMAVYSDTSEIDVTSSVTVSNFNASTAGNKTATVSYNGKTATFNYVVKWSADASIPTVKINNNPGTKTINYGEGIKFTATATDMPEGAKIVWFVNDKKADEGESFTFSDAKADATITVKIVDKDGNVMKDATDGEISESEKVIVNAGFFKKLISFFKNLFKINRIVVQSVDSKNAY